MKFVAGIDLGGTAVNYTLVSAEEEFLIQGLCEHPARAKEGPSVCMTQIEEGLQIALQRTGVPFRDVVAVGLDTPGPASAKGVFSRRGSTNFAHTDWSGFDVRSALERRLGLPVTYLNDGNAGALWGHFSLFGASSGSTSVSAIIGTGLGGGIIVDDRVVKGSRGFGAELGHVLIPYTRIAGLEGALPVCNCGREGDLESLCSLTAILNTLLPHFLRKFPNHELAKLNDLPRAAKLVRGLAEKSDPMCLEIFRIQAQALGLFFDIMINTFDPDALIVGGGAIETGPAFRHWFIEQIRGAMPQQREEQASIPIHIMPNGDCAGARGAAVDALAYARERGLVETMLSRPGVMD